MSTNYNISPYAFISFLDVFRMKIGIVVRLLHPAGAQKTAIIEAEYLAKIGHEVIVFFIRKPNNFSYYYEDLLININYKILNYENPSIKRYLYDFITGLYMKDRKGELRVDLNLLKTFYNDIKSEKLDYLICHDQYAGIAGFYAYKKLGIPYSIVVHEKIPNYSKLFIGPLISIELSKVFLNSRYIFSISDKISQTIVNFDNRFSNKIVFNIQGMNYPSISYNYKQKRDEIVSVSMWDSGRKPLLYLNIAKALPEKKFIMIGSWRELQMKDKFLIKMHDDKINNVFLEEGISEVDLKERIARAKYLLRFGYGEYGVAQAVLESIQSLTPVIINSELGTAQIIKEKGGGLVEDDLRKIPNIIRSMESETSYDLLQESLKKIREKYTWESHVKKLLCGNSPQPDNLPA